MKPKKQQRTIAPYKITGRAGVDPHMFNPRTNKEFAKLLNKVNRILLEKYDLVEVLPSANEIQRSHFRETTVDVEYLKSLYYENTFKFFAKHSFKKKADEYIFMLFCEGLSLTEIEAELSINTLGYKKLKKSAIGEKINHFLKIAGLPTKEEYVKKVIPPKNSQFKFQPKYVLRVHKDNIKLKIKPEILEAIANKIVSDIDDLVLPFVKYLKDIESLRTDLQKSMKVA